MEDYKKLLTELYSEHDPERVKQVDYFLAKYKGKEKQFYISQKAKYKSKKPVSDSKKIIEEALARIKSQSEEKSTKEEKHVEEESNTEIMPESTPKAEPVKPESKTIPPKEEPPKEIEKAEETESEKQTRETTIHAIEEEPTPKVTAIEDLGQEEDSTAKEPAKKEASPVWFKESGKQTAGKQAPLPQKESSSSKKKYGLYLVGIVVLILLLSSVVYYVFFYKSSPDKSTKQTAKTQQTTVVKKETKADPEKTATAKTNKQATTNQTTSKTPPPAKKETQTVTPILGSAHLKKGDIQLPAYFVACYAVKKEAFAQEKVNKLKDKGFDAKYYWIPDFVSDGNTYYKVVIGPYSTRNKAMEMLTPVQEKAEFDAYVLELK